VSDLQEIYLAGGGGCSYAMVQQGDVHVERVEWEKHQTALGWLTSGKTVSIRIPGTEFY
jgi:hypothetical protein